MPTENTTTFANHLDERYGKQGAPLRSEFEMKSKSFRIGEMIKEERRLANMTQEQLAEKSGTKKAYISRIENGKSDIQLATLYKIIETGLGKRLDLIIA